MATLKAIYALPQTENFKGRVAAAMWQTAYNIAVESPATTNHAARIVLAKSWITMGVGDTDCIKVARVVALDSAVQAAGENGLDAVESNILAIVAGVVNFFA